MGQGWPRRARHGGDDEGRDQVRQVGLRTVFQPIVEVASRRVVAYEALSRGRAPSETPRVLFDLARTRGEVPGLDRACLITALASAVQLGGAPLSVNVSASTLSADPGFGAFLVRALREVGRRPVETMLEVVDLTPAFDRRVFRDNLDVVRAAGVRLALDGFGSGHSNHLMLLDVRPDDLKIDRCLLRTAEADAYGRAVLGSLVELAERLGIRTIAQGVETSADLGALQSAGIGLAQGFFFMPPLSAEALMLATDPGTGTV